MFQIADGLLLGEKVTPVVISTRSSFGLSGVVQNELFLTQENEAMKIRNFRGYCIPEACGFMSQRLGRSKEKW